MDALMEELCKRREALATARKEAEKMIEGAPEGKVRVTTCRGNIQYYHVIDGRDVNGKYICCGEDELVTALVQKDYAEKLIKSIDAELWFLDSYIHMRTKNSPDKVYTNLSTQRLKLAKPILVTPEMFKEMWMKSAYISNPMLVDQKVYETKRGEKVRSKSELLFANLYADLGIPYRYECELRLPDGSVKYPDFTLLDVNHHRLVYHEHFGLMDDPVYRESCFQKLDLYRRNGVYLGKNLIATFEGKGSELNMREYRKMMGELFLLKKQS